jgi:Tfp pilus assembly protein PilO
VTALFHSQFLPTQASLQSLINDISKLDEQDNEQAESSNQRSVHTMIAILVAVLVIVVGWVVVLSRSIQQALGGEPDYAAHLCKQIADGDLTNEGLARGDRRQCAGVQIFQARLA